MVHFLVNLIYDFGFHFPFFSKSWLVVVYNGHSNNLKNTINYIVTFCSISEKEQEKVQ